MTWGEGDKEQRGVFSGRGRTKQGKISHVEYWKWLFQAPRVQNFLLGGGGPEFHLERQVL